MSSTLSNTLKSVVLDYLEDLACPIALSVGIQIRYNDWEAVARRKVEPQWFISAEDYFKAASAVALLKKMQRLLPNDAERRQAAVEKWFEAEKACYLTNQRLTPYLPGFNLERDEDVAFHLGCVRKIVEEVIGFRPPPTVEGRFGPGATYADKGSRSTVPHKISSDPTLTPNAVWHLPQFFGTLWGAAVVASDRKLKFVKGNRFTTVPKTSIIDRCIGVEPSINVFYQLAYGRELRRRLKLNTGWDLDYAQDIHREVAREASVTMEFSTMDLSSASDTVATNLVRVLLPPGWYEVLEDLRSPCSSHPDHPEKMVVLEKFSSMGNGYTFELETIIFAALALHATRFHGYEGRLGRDVFVFGDDIICRREVFEPLKALLEFCGFSLNSEKSFTGNSPFRESCGGDYFLGSDVRPAYLKEDPCDPKGAIGVANRIFTNFEKLANLGVYTRSRSWRTAVQAVPLPYRGCRGPKALGDAVLWEEDEGKWRMRWKHSIRYIKGIKAGKLAVVPFSRFDPSVVLACATYGTGNVGTPERGHVPEVEGVTPRDPIRSYVVGWLAYS